MDLETKIRKAQEVGKILPGEKSVLGVLGTKDAEMIVIAKNLPRDKVEVIKNRAKVAGIEVTEYDGTSEGLGALCRKPFSVAVCAILK